MGNNQENESQKLELKIDGISCQACVAKIERKLSRTNGVGKALVNISNNMADIEYNEKEIKDKDWGTPIINFVKRYGGILLGLSILNRWTFNFGEFSKSNPGLMIFLSGWLFIPLISLLLFAEGQILKNFVKSFYFFKYRKEYREYFNITNEQWYGKFFARFMSKS